MLFKTSAIILSKIRISDHKEILKCYTKEGGMASIVFYNKSAKKSSQRTNFQIFQEVELVYQSLKEAQLPVIKEFTISKSRIYLLENPVNGLIGMFLAELLSACIGEHEKNEMVFGFMQEVGDALDDATPRGNDFLLWSMLHLAQILGFRPASIDVLFEKDAIFFDPLQGCFDVPRSTSLPKTESMLLNDLLIQYENDQPIQVSKELRLKAIQLLLDFYQIHIPNLRVPKSLGVVVDVLYS